MRGTSETLNNSKMQTTNLRVQEDWTPAKRIRLKSKPLVQSKEAERDAHTVSNTWKTTSCGEWQHCSTTRQEGDQPEEATVKEQRVDDIVIDQGPRDAGVTKMRMDEMLMDQVMAVSNGNFTRLC